MTEPLPDMFIHSSSSPAISPSYAGRTRTSTGESESNERVLLPISAGNASKPAAQVHLSEEAQQALAVKAGQTDIESESQLQATETKEAEQARTKAGQTDSKSESQATEGGANKLSEEEKQQVAELKARDAEVKAHEQAHVAASGGHTKGGIKYETERGPDGKQYAVGGHVSIDTAPVAGDPRRTIQKAETVRRAALAPSEPSGADRQVAAAAANTVSHARAELAAEEQAKLQESDETTKAGDPKEDSPISSYRTKYAHAAYAQAAA